ncbi:MAG: SDR family oxidoreductase [Eubacteriales bacterium]|nr:SDR family oxidoreductase [Eubacteriales bacterium]
MTNNPDNKTVWVTGASSGLGLYCAKALCDAGFNVVGGARSFNKKELKHPFKALYLDVCDEKSCDEFVENALKIYGEPYALINAAGILHLSPCETIKTDELHNVLNVNLLGTHRMVRRVLPYMRKNNSGHIINFSSINGLFATPYQGAYSAAKHAIEGFSEALYMETARFGVFVTLVEPGDHKGGKTNYRLKENNLHDCYKNSYKNVVDKITKDEDTGSDPELLAKKIVRLIQGAIPPFRLVIADPFQKLSVLLKKLLPSKVFLSIVSKYYGV